MNATQRLLAAALLAGATWILNMASAESNERASTLFAATRSSVPSHLPVEGKFPPLSGATGWLNSAPLSPEGLRGKVVLIDFWTFSCINWLRTMPYVRAWTEKYKDHGLVVIGVHTPEFAFEQDADQVRRFVKDYRIDYPVALDSNYAIWRAFDNAYWPAIYLIDAQGRIRHHRFGEGEYAQAERVIQQLLIEAGFNGFDRALVVPDGRGAEAAPDWANLRTAETYVGYARAENFVSSGGAAREARREYAIPSRLRINQWALAGDWTVKKEFALLNKPGGKIAFKFHARDLHLVMKPTTRDTSIRFRVLLDGEPPGRDHGVDVDEQGNGTLTGPRLYQLIRQRATISDRQFEIEFLDPGAEAFSFTFG